jgi:phospholipase/lecithinase/hemolysin
MSRSVPGFLLLLGFLSVCLTTPLQAGPYSEIFIFGDSLSDSGNRFELSGGAIPADPRYDTGRFSDGPIWVEILAEELGLTVTPIEVSSGGNNFAVGGARATLDLDPPGPGVVPSVATQVETYLDGVDEADPDALYVVSGGANDIVAATAPFNDFPEAEQIEIAEDAAIGIAEAVRTLAEAGAIHFLVPNLPDLGLAPRASDLDIEADSTARSSDFNAELASQLEDIAADADLDVEIHTYDAFALLVDIHENGDAYGITNVDDPAFEGFCDSEGFDPSESLFVDCLHPTSESHAIFGHAVVDVAASPVAFQRGDANDNGEVSLADALYTLEYLFLDETPTLCLDAADFQDDGDIDLVDAILLLTHLFGPDDAEEPAPPFGECDLDPTSDTIDDRLHCVEFDDASCP